MVPCGLREFGQHCFQEQHFPGADVKPFPAGKKNPKFIVADDNVIESDGQMSFPTFTQEKNDLNISWVNGDVDLPILSTKRLADDTDRLLCYGKDRGLIFDPTTGQKNIFVAANGVYFIKLHVHKDILGGAAGPFARPGADA